MSLDVLFTLVTYTCPVATCSAVLFLWCSYWVEGWHHYKMRAGLMWAGLALAVLSETLTVLLVVAYHGQVVTLISDHSHAVTIILICHAISFAALAFYTAVNMRPRYKDAPAKDYYSPLPYELSHGKVPDTIMGVAFGGTINDFNAEAAGYAASTYAPNSDVMCAFDMGASWAAGTVTLYPDEVEYLRRHHEDVEQVKHALALIGAFRTSGKIVTWKIPELYGYGPKPVTLNLDKSDED